MAETRIKVTSGRHIYQMGVASGMRTMVERLRKVPDNQKWPGFALALATAEALAADEYAYSISRNLALIAKSGGDVATHKAAAFDPQTSELIVTNYEPGLLDDIE